MLLKILKAINFVLSQLTITGVIYAYIFHEMMRYYKNALFVKENDSLIGASTVLYVIQGSFAQIFGVISLLFDIAPMCNGKVMKYYAFAENYLYRGIFHTWYAISQWTAFSSSLSFGILFSPKTVINITAWALLATGAAEISIFLVQKITKMRQSSKMNPDDHLNNEIIVNRVEVNVNSEKPHCRKFFERLLRKEKDCSDQSQHVITENQTMDLSNCIPISSKEQFLDDKIDCEDMGTTEFFLHSVLNLSNIIPQKYDASRKASELEISYSVNKTKTHRESDNTNNSLTRKISNEESFQKMNDKLFMTQENENHTVMTARQELSNSHNYQSANGMKLDDTICSQKSKMAEMYKFPRELIESSPEAIERCDFYHGIVDSIDWETMQNDILEIFDTQSRQKLKCSENYIDKKKGTCYKVTINEKKQDKEILYETLEEAILDGDAEELHTYYYLSPTEERKKWDNNADSCEVQYVLVKDDTLYFFCRQVTKKVLIIKSREYVFCVGIKTLPNGDSMFLLKSYDDKYCLPTKGIERAYFEKAGGIVTSMFEPMDIKASQSSQLDITQSESKLSDNSLKKTFRYTLVNPRIKIPIKMARPSMASFFRNFHKNFYDSHKKYAKSGQNNWQEVINKVIR